MKIRFIKLYTALFAVALFSAGCNMLPGGIGGNESAQTDSQPNDVYRAEGATEAWGEYARDNLDLRAVGSLLEKADNAEEFEYLLNTEGVNNLDLNSDGYADYISVEEFGDRGDNERGLSLFSRFGPDLIQEIATIILDRDGFNSDARGARVLMRGDEQLYGDNYYYETNWLDRSLAIADWLFNENRDDNYRSPYYYNNYPDNYEAYEIVETPDYRSRIRQVYYVADNNQAAPVFVQTSNPTVVEDVKIRSPYDGMTVVKNFPKPGKLSKEEKELRKLNRDASRQAEFVTDKKDKIKNVPPGLMRADERRMKGNPNKFDQPREKFESPRFEPKEKPDKVWKQAVKQQQKQQKFESRSFNPQPQPQLQPPGQMKKAEKQNMKPPKFENNDGGGKQKGNGNGGGNGKGGGKKG